ncbi:hypothetical protein K402DRAFT_422203 [Aulographum hederae CBS 113979]|uniref:Zn(2)-C6 fungal-type domain-containing protein n=1 Tax=Aulographum hederae CBS 113979 TaxID=1176131 RepID=A0A6G1GWX7_9PEZI|nr:hypothetical protein K402DRAFT_422203 [Aulographum hederae CBS 113979]
MDSTTSPPNDLDAASAPHVQDDVSPHDEDHDHFENESQTNEDEPGKPSLPMQKRRRVTRACDECRRKKIKCDGKQPCTHCTVYSYECTYDQPSNRRRNAAPQYIEALEARLKRAEAIINILLPGVNIDDPALETALRQGAHVPAQTGLALSANGVQKPPPKPMPTFDVRLDSMVKATGQLDLDEQGYWDYHGHSSGLSFIRKMRDKFGGLMGPEGQATPFVKSRPLSQVFDHSPTGTADSPMEGSFLGHDLPSKTVAVELCELAINDATSLLRIVHMPTFMKSLDRIYATTAENYTNAENSFLPLLYAVMALGCLFARDDNGELDRKGYGAAIDHGFKYFKASRHLLDITDCRDLVGLQAVLFMILFLQSSAKLSTCYSYIGVATRVALRMGLHRSFSTNFDPIENETRKRLFWVIRKMDIYVGALLGLPHTVSDDDIDQEMPAEVDDEYITETEILPMPEGKVSIMMAFNAHTKLVNILGKIVKYIYPIKNPKPAQAGSFPTYSVGYEQIRELEQDLQTWMEQLPMGLKPGGEQPPIIIRVQQLLRLAYAHSQMMLYRPFLHYVSQTCRRKTQDKRSFACAAAGVSVSRNIIHITGEMKRRGLLYGAYWFSMYTTFFAVLSIVYFALENDGNPTSEEMLRDAYEGRNTLDELAKRSMAADRCKATLKGLFDYLEKRKQTRKTLPTPAFTRKHGRDPSPMPPAVSSQDNESKPNGLVHNFDAPRRAATFPETTDVKRDSYPYQMANSQAGFSTGSPYATSQEILESTPVLTPNSSSTGSMPFQMMGTQQQQQNSSQQQQFSPNMQSFLDPSFSDPNVPLPDFNPLMFSSGDPFAYPSQNGPLTRFEDAHYAQAQPNQGFATNKPGSSGNDMPSLYTHSQSSTTSIPTSNPVQATSNNSFIPPSSTFMTKGVDTPPNGQDVGVGFLGPMPMYLYMQGNQNPLEGHNSLMGLPPSSGPRVGGNEEGTMDLNELFAGDDWVGFLGTQGNVNGNVNGTGNVNGAGGNGNGGGYPDLGTNGGMGLW